MTRTLIDAATTLMFPILSLLSQSLVLLGSNINVAFGVTAMSILNCLYFGTVDTFRDFNEGGIDDEDEIVRRRLFLVEFTTDSE